MRLIFSIFYHPTPALGQRQDHGQRLETEVILTEVQASFICLAISGQVLWTTSALKYVLCPMLISPFHGFTRVQAFTDSFVGPQNSFPAGPSRSSRSFTSNPLSILCRWQMTLPKTPLSFSCMRKLSSSNNFKTFQNLVSCHPPQSYLLGSEYLFSDMVKSFSTQAHKPTIVQLLFGFLTWYALLFPSVS